MRGLLEQQRPTSVAARAMQRGVTLVEILVVVAIMTLIAAGVGFAVLTQHGKAQQKLAGERASTLRSAAMTWRVNGHTGCPTVEELRASEELDPSDDAKDPWGQSYGIRCEGNTIIVRSSGIDGQPETDDDVVVGEPIDGP